MPVFPTKPHGVSHGDTAWHKGEKNSPVETLFVTVLSFGTLRCHPPIKREPAFR
jgi:hypothetical protein